MEPSSTEKHWLSWGRRFFTGEALVRCVNRLFPAWNGKTEEPPDSDDHLLLGAWGERVAEKHLRRQGFKLLMRNFRDERGGEVDLVFRDRRLDELVFVEVKTRWISSEFIRPSDSVGESKRIRLTKGALAWLRLLKRTDIVARFDVVEVVAVDPDGKTEITHLRDAFPAPDPYIW